MLAVITLFSLAACGKKSEDDGWNPEGGITVYDPYESVEGTGTSGGVSVSSEKTALNPLTGEYNMAQDRVGMRPIAVAVNNIKQSWPQYGISEADYILEIETEGGITRLMCVYSDTREIESIGSIRSLRDQFIEALYPLDPLIVHFGTSIYADNALQRYNMRMLDAMVVTPAVWTDKVRAQSYATEHTKFTGGAAIEKGIDAAGITATTASKATAFNFINPDDPIIVPEGGDASAVYYNFSKDYDGDFRYDETTGTYKKWQFGKEHVDAGADNKQLEFTNLVLLFADIDLIPGQDKGLVKVEFQNGGEGYYFTQGKYEKFTWYKDDFISDFRFVRDDGSEIEINVGKTHMGIIRNDYKDTFEITA